MLTVGLFVGRQGSWHLLGYSCARTYILCVRWSRRLNYRQNMRFPSTYYFRIFVEKIGTESQDKTLKVFKMLSDVLGSLFCIEGARGSIVG
jgi:hypothetical protein